VDARENTAADAGVVSLAHGAERPQRLRIGGQQGGESMKVPRIHFLDMPKSETVEAKILDRTSRLSRFSADIQKSEVWVRSPHGHHRKGRLYGIRIRLTVPGEEIDVDLQPDEEDVYVSIRDAFDAARLKLEDYERRRRGEVKAHPRARDGERRRRQVPPRDQRA
jgi:ribosome-associated translation inhibitor RaiA